MLVMANFSKSSKLRLFLEMAQFVDYPLLGYVLPVSFRKPSSFSRSLVIYPQDGYDFFSGIEVKHVVDIASSFGLTVFVDIENGVPVIRVSEYFKV